MNSALASCSGSSVKGFLKLCGFAAMIVLSLPFYYGMRYVPGYDPTSLPIHFHRFLSRLLGLRVRVHGLPDVQPSTLFVSNHSSYLDIVVLGSLLRASFVAKAEVNKWPVIGLMARVQNTVFIERRSVHAREQSDVLRVRLEKGSRLILFPEGTSSDGQRTLPFKSSLFSIVEKPFADGAFPTVQPISIVATEINGLPMGRFWRPFYAWYGDMTLVKHVWEFFKIGGFTVDVVFHPPVTVQDFGSRKLLSDYCQRVIAKGVDACLTGRFEKGLAGGDRLLPKPSHDTDAKLEKIPD